MGVAEGKTIAQKIRKSFENFKTYQPSTLKISFFILHLGSVCRHETF